MTSNVKGVTAPVIVFALATGWCVSAWSAEAATNLVGRPTHGFRLAGEFGASLYGSSGEPGRSFSGAVRGTHRTGAWSAALLLRLDTWRSSRVTEMGDEWQSSLDLGLGGEVVYLEERARTALYVGPSLLLSGADIDEPGPRAGLFVDLRPLGLRFPVAERWTLGLDPLGFALLVPDLSATPLIEVQFATTLWVEVAP